MSKAEEWAQARKQSTESRPRWGDGKYQKAHVMDDGSLYLGCIPLDPDDALSLGKWVLETYGGRDE